jgi:hypothetical protein
MQSSAPATNLGKQQTCRLAECQRQGIDTNNTTMTAAATTRRLHTRELASKQGKHAHTTRTRTHPTAQPMMVLQKPHDKRRCSVCAALLMRISKNTTEPTIDPNTAAA